MTSTRSANAKALPAEQPIFNDPREFPDIYGLTVKGTCMEPGLPDGCNIKVSKSEPYGVNDVVVVWLKPECVQPGHTAAMVKRLVMAVPPWVRGFPYKDSPTSDVVPLVFLGRDEMPGKMFSICCSKILAMHKCCGILAPEETDDSWPENARRGSRMPS